MIKNSNLIENDYVSVPCGRCYGCRLDIAKQWSIRCVHEAQMHEHNCLIHLTYNEECIPSDGSVNKRHLQLFIKRLRRRIEPIKILYYGCGEYGEKLGRPHYHVLIFGYDFADKTPWKTMFPTKFNRFSTAPSYIMYRSETLEKLWKYGYSGIGDITIESAGYVARYIRKKITGDIAPKHYKGKKPEFPLMSRRPAVGKNWFEKYTYDVYPKDFLHFDGKAYKPPRYYDKLLQRRNYKMFESIKNKRRENVVKENPKRLMDKQKFKRLVTKSLIRRYEIDE